MQPGVPPLGRQRHPLRRGQDRAAWSGRQPPGERAAARCRGGGEPSPELRPRTPLTLVPLRMLLQWGPVGRALLLRLVLLAEEGVAEVADLPRGQLLRDLDLLDLAGGGAAEE